MQLKNLMLLYLWIPTAVGDTVYWNFAGFALTGLEDGTWALSTALTKLAVHNNITQIQFFTVGGTVPTDWQTS